MSLWRCRHGVGAGDWCDDCNMPAVVDVLKSVMRPRSPQDEEDQR